jgi:tetratricopeptide (TPR) repeat protein
MNPLKLLRTPTALVPLLLISPYLGCSSSQQAGRGEISKAVKPPPPTVEKTSDGVSTRAKLLFEDAIKAYEAQKKSKTPNYALVESRFKAVLAEDSNFAEAEYNLGVLAERQGRKDDAIDHYRSALKKKPTLKAAAENLAVIAQNEGRTDEAMHTYENIIDSYPEDASARARLAEMHREKGDQERAMELARQALIREPKTLMAYKVMMHIYLEKKQLSLAKLVALRALKIDENDPEIYHTVGLILLAEKDSVKALVQFKKALEVRPSYVPAHIMLAKIALQHENYSGAEQHLRHVLQYKNAAEAHLDLGVAYKGLGQYDKALQEYEVAEKLNPELAPIFLNRGIIFHRHKDAPEKAVENYKRYLALAGGEASLPADAPVFALLTEAEQIIQAKAEGKRSEAEAKKTPEPGKARPPPEPAGAPKEEEKAVAREVSSSKVIPAKVKQRTSKEEENKEDLEPN